MKRALASLALAALTAPALAQTPDRPAAVPPPMPQAIEPSRETPPLAVAGGDWRASKLIGTTVHTMQDQSVGEIEDVILDNEGKVVSVVVSVGGFLGLGEKHAAVAFKDLTLSRSEDGEPLVRTSLSKQALETAPDAAD